MASFRTKLVASLLFGLLLAGCGSPDAQSETANSSASPVPSVPTASVTSSVGRRVSRMPEVPPSRVATAARIEITRTDPANAHPLAGTLWVLTRLSGGRFPGRVPGSGIYVEFQDATRVAGSGRCNAYSGSYTASRARIDIAVTTSPIRLPTPTGDITRIPAPPIGQGECLSEAHKDQEYTYLDGLENATSYRIAADRLGLADRLGRTILEYRQVDTDRNAPDLTGTNWRLSRLNGKKPHEATETTLSFENTYLSGYKSCNHYSAPYSTYRGILAVSGMGGTAIGCPSPFAEHETEYGKALAFATTYEVVNGVLRVENAEGELVLEFVKHGPS